MSKIIFILLFLLILTGCNAQLPEEKDMICNNNCINNGWEQGKWAGFQYCNCYNESILIKLREEGKWLNQNFLSVKENAQECTTKEKSARTLQYSTGTVTFTKINKTNNPQVLYRLFFLSNKLLKYVKELSLRTHTIL